MKKINKNKQAKQKISEIKAAKIGDNLEELKDIEKIRNDLYNTNEKIKLIESELDKFEQKSKNCQGNTILIIHNKY